MMLEMRGKLLNKREVFVPIPKKGAHLDDGKIKLYKVKFGNLFPEPDGKMYIPDPLLLLIKAAVNLSAHNYSQDCKLLPACPSVSSAESSNTGGLQSREGFSGIQTADPEIPRIVCNDEDDAVSVSSDFTC